MTRTTAILNISAKFGLCCTIPIYKQKLKLYKIILEDIHKSLDYVSLYQFVINPINKKIHTQILHRYGYRHQKDFNYLYIHLKVSKTYMKTLHEG